MELCGCGFWILLLDCGQFWLVLGFLNVDVVTQRYWCEKISICQQICRKIPLIKRYSFKFVVWRCTCLKTNVLTSGLFTQIQFDPKRSTILLLISSCKDEEIIKEEPNFPLWVFSPLSLISSKVPLPLPSLHNNLRTTMPAQGSKAIIRCPLITASYPWW